MNKCQHEQVYGASVRGKPAFAIHPARKEHPVQSMEIQQEMNVLTSADVGKRKTGSNTPSQETVLDVKHYTDRLFRFSITRPRSFRFRSGEFIMVGLPDENGGRPLLRAYSMASPQWDETLEFYSIKIANGPLTSRLQNIRPGDKILLGRKPVGTLVLDALTPARRLYLFSTGTGFAPFASLIRDLALYQAYEDIIVTHTCREVAELQYSRDVVAAFQADRDTGDICRGKLRLYQTCTREGFAHTGRITDQIRSGELFTNLGVPPIMPAVDRAMICGSVSMTKEMKTLMQARGLKEGANSRPADFVVERAFTG